MRAISKKKLFPGDNLEVLQGIIRISFSPSSEWQQQQPRNRGLPGQQSTPCLPEHQAFFLPQLQLPDALPISVFQLEYEDARRSSVLKQTLVQFPNQMLKLPECPLKDFLEQVTCPIPEHLSDVNDTKDVYYLDMLLTIKKQTPNQHVCTYFVQLYLHWLYLITNPARWGIFMLYLPLNY